MINYRSLYALYLVAFIDLFAVSLFLPLLSKEIRDLGGDPVLIGIIGSVYGGVQLFSSPIVGWGSDKQGSKLVLFICLLSTAIAYALQGYASSLSIFLIARALAGCFKHTQTIGKSIITDLAPQLKSHVLGNFNAFGSMGFILGPTIGALLVENEGGFQSVCLLASIAFLVNIVILVLLVSTKRKTKTWSLMSNNVKLKEDEYCDNSTKGTNWFGFNGILSSSSSYNNTGGDTSLKYSVIGILFLRFVFSSSTIIPRANMPITFESKFDTRIVHIGYLNSMQALVSTLTGFAVGPVVSRFYHNDSEKMVKDFGIIKALSLLALVVAPTFRLAGFSMLVQSAADPFLRVGITSMSLDGHNDYGTILGLGQTATSLSRMLAPFVAGISQKYISDDGPAIMGTICGVIGLIWSYLVGIGTGKKKLYNSSERSRSSLFKFWQWGRKIQIDTLMTNDDQPLLINEMNSNKKSVTNHLKL